MSTKSERAFRAARKRSTSRRSRRSRASRRASRRSGNFSPQPITRPGSRAGLVDVIEVNARGETLRVLHRNVSYQVARDLIRTAHL